MSDYGLETQARAIYQPVAVKGVSGVYEIPVLGETRQIDYRELERMQGEFKRVLHDGIRKAAIRIEGGFAGHQHQEGINKDQKVVAWISELFSGSGDLPSLTIWDQPRTYLKQSQEAIRRGDLLTAAMTLERAELTSVEAYQRILSYRENVITGAGRAVTTLEITRDVSVAVAGILATAATGGAAGAFIATGIGASTNLAQQASELSLGMRDRIDWAGIGFDAVIGLVLGKFLGGFGNKIAARIIGRNPALASLGRKIISSVVANLVTGQASSAFHMTARAIFDNLRGAKNAMTIEQFLDALVDQLTNPRAIFMNLLMGELDRRMANRLSKGKVTAPEQEPPPGGGSTNKKSATDTEGGQEASQSPAKEADQSSSQSTLSQEKAGQQDSQIPAQRKGDQTLESDASSGSRPDLSQEGKLYDFAREKMMRQAALEENRQPPPAAQAREAKVLSLAERRASEGLKKPPVSKETDTLAESQSQQSVKEAETSNVIELAKVAAERNQTKLQQAEAGETVMAMASGDRPRRSTSGAPPQGTSRGQSTAVKSTSQPGPSAAKGSSTARKGKSAPPEITETAQKPKSTVKKNPDSEEGSEGASSKAKKSQPKQYPERVEKYVRELIGRFPSLANADLRPNTRGAGKGMIEEAMTTGSQSPTLNNMGYSYRAKLQDGRGVQIDNIEPNGRIVEHKDRTPPSLLRKVMKRKIEREVEEDGPDELNFDPDRKPKSTDDRVNAVVKAIMNKDQRRAIDQMRRQSKFIEENNLPQGIWQTNSKYHYKLYLLIKRMYRLDNIEIEYHE